MNERTSNQIPAGVNLTPERHERLVAQLAAGRAPGATAEEVRAGLLAGNALLTAYWTVIVRRARAGLHGAAADDRAGEAGVRAVMAVRCFDPARGASLLTHLAAQRVWSGEAVATAALPIGAPVSRADRRASWLAGDGVATVLSLDADPALGEMAGPDRGQEAFERELDVRSAMRSLDGRDREWLTAAYGLGGARMIPTEDLAAAEGVSVHTVRRSLAHSREALRDSLSELAFSN